MAGISRRELLRATGGAGLWMALGLGGASGLARSAFASETGSPPAAGRPYNILFLLTDQERHFDRWPMPVPGRERLRKMGVEFSNHQIASNACTSSRSVIYTGQSMQRTKMFDNVNSPWVGDLSTEIPTLGDMLREAGYDTAYNGSWHLAKRFQEATDAMEEYGFSDSVGVGDIVGQASGGYHHDEIITAMAVRWLRSKGRTMARDSRPWLLAVNLINPHDVMYVNTDEPGTPVQDTGQLALPIAQPPDSAIYRADWDAPLSGSRRQRFDDPGRPAAHREYQRARGWLVGNWPDEDRRWRKVQDYYYNCIRDSDRHFERILRELDDLGLTESTIIVWTSDHGELAGAHGMHGVGACAYEEQNHVPLVIAHPEVPGGMKCGALTSHLDLAPTLVGLTGIGSEKAGRITADLKGHDLTPLLADPAGAAADAVRPAGALFSYNMWLYQDADFVERHVAAGN
ncbi:MAG: sulfatase-like hydrolase/transferase, partial [Proteobacteria bacterium]|nr:sulfatase-like hydrolase/transferase [Pseudomonadota bacterium]